MLKRNLYVNRTKYSIIFFPASGQWSLVWDNTVHHRKVRCKKVIGREKSKGQLFDSNPRSPRWNPVFLLLELLLLKAGSDNFESQQADRTSHRKKKKTRKCPRDVDQNLFVPRLVDPLRKDCWMRDGRWNSKERSVISYSN